MDERLLNQHRLKNHIRARLLERAGQDRFDAGRQNDAATAAVLFFLGMHRFDQARRAEPCLIFNQRSRHVRQPGDLCFPGGGLSPRLDGFLARLMGLPGFPLFRWAKVSRRHSRRPPSFKGMHRLLATSLRESFEEMRLSPFRVGFLGPMAPEYFNLQGRTIYPMVAWNRGQKTFSPNREVDRIVYIPLRRFFHQGAYTRLPAARLSRYAGKITPSAEFPCLVYDNGERREILWGLTYRIVVRFLEIVFDYIPPEMSSRPVLSKKEEITGHAFKGR